MSIQYVILFTLSVGLSVMLQDMHIKILEMREKGFVIIFSYIFIFMILTNQ